ncbi:hypothetical protein Tco_1522465 [Tanacetum coccineum]
MKERVHRWQDPNHLIRNVQSPQPRDKKTKGHMLEFLSDSGEEDDEKISRRRNVCSTSTKMKVWICQISQESGQKRTRERMSYKKLKEIKAEAERDHASASTVTCS